MRFSCGKAFVLRGGSLNQENRPVEVELPIELIVHQTRKKHRLRVTIAWGDMFAMGIAFFIVFSIGSFFIWLLVAGFIASVF